MTKTKWVPQIDDLYYTIESDLPSSFAGHKFDIQNIENGNYFQTPELRQQAIEMLKKAFHGYTIKKPALFPVNELEYLEARDSYQDFSIELIDKENNFMVFANFWVDVCADIDGDDWNIPRTSQIKWSKIFDLSFDICDENGDEVEDENGLFYNELLTFLKDYYEK